MNKLFPFFAFFLLVSVYAASEDCVCLDIYQPVCASRKGIYQSFPNECEATCRGFKVKRAGKCFPKMVEIDVCKSRCSAQIDIVCGQKNNSTRDFINQCFADCDGYVTVRNGTCDHARVLGFSQDVKNWWNKTKSAINNAFGKSKAWFKDQSAKFVNGTKNLYHLTKQGWENCSCFILTDLENAGKKLVNATKNAIQKIEDSAQRFKNKTEEQWKNFKENAKQKLEKAKNNTKEAWNRIKNKTKDALNKLKNFTLEEWNLIKTRSIRAWNNLKNNTVAAWNEVQSKVRGWANETKAFANKTKKWFIEKGQAIKNKTVTWWHAVKGEWESCSCCVLNKTSEVLERIENHAKDLLNRTKARLEEFANKVRDFNLVFANKASETAGKIKAWFDKLKPCLCTREYIPVCVDTPEGERATMLNPCYAQCGGLTFVKEGPCDEHGL